MEKYYLRDPSLLLPFLEYTCEQIDSAGLKEAIKPALLKEIFDIDYHMLKYLAGEDLMSYKPRNRFDSIWEKYQ